MTFRRVTIAVSMFCLLISCGGSNTGGKGGAGGASAGASGTAGSTGSAGTTGSGGGPADCQACVDCVNASCASQVATCRANTGCNMVYQCAAACTASIETCIMNNVAAAQMFVTSVYPCISSNCATQCAQ